MAGERVAVIGAGVTGLAAAFVLRRAGLPATVFERGPHLGGRLRTVELSAARFDTGAQFFRTEGGPFEDLVLRTLPRDDLLDVRADVRPFDVTGRLGPGDAAQNEAPKWVYRRGLAQLAALLVAAARPDVRLGREVATLTPGGDGWRVHGPWGDDGPFGAVVVALPGPAVAALLRASGPATALAAAVLASSRYRPIISIGFVLAQPAARDPALYALVNSDRQHAISWLAFEDAKPGYVPPGRGLLVAQMAPGWSEPRLFPPDAELAAAAWAAVRGLTGEAQQPLSWHVTRWRHALPDTLIDAGSLAAQAPPGLFLAGDFTAGGRVHMAAASGLASGESAAAFLAR